MIRADIGSDRYSTSVSANTQGSNIGIVSEVKKLYRDTPSKHHKRVEKQECKTIIHGQTMKQKD